MKDDQEKERTAAINEEEQFNLSWAFEKFLLGLEKAFMPNFISGSLDMGGQKVTEASIRASHIATALEGIGLYKLLALPDGQLSGGIFYLIGRFINLVNEGNAINQYKQEKNKV